MEILDFIALWAAVSVVVGALLGMALHRMGDDTPIAKPSFVDSTPIEDLADDLQPRDQLVS